MVIRSYRRVFEVDRRIYRVDRWALPVPGGVPLRAVGYFAAALLAMIAAGALPGIGELVGGAVAADPVRRPAAGGRRARHAGGAGRPRGAPVRVGLAAPAAARAAALRGPRRAARGRADRVGRRARAALRRRRARAAPRACARAGAGHVQRAGAAVATAAAGLVAHAAAGGRACRSRWCCAAARRWRCGREPVPAALRAPEHPRRPGRRAGGAVPRRHGLVSVPGGGRQARLAGPAGAVRVLGRGRLLALARVPRLSGRALRAAGARRCWTRARSRRRRGGRTCAGTRRTCASCARSCPRSTSRSR